MMGTDSQHGAENLAPRAGMNDQDRLAASFEEHRGRLRKMIELRLDPRLRGRVDPSDVIQEAFLEASARLPEYQRNPAVPLFVWLRFITGQRLMIAYRRHLGTRARDAGREVSLDQGMGLAATSAVLAHQLLGHLTTPSQAAVRAERKALLENSLERMDPVDREVLFLRHFEELSNSETAGTLGISPTAANNRYVRALRRLRSALDAVPGAEEEFRDGR